MQRQRGRRENETRQREEFRMHPMLRRTLALAGCFLISSALIVAHAAQARPIAHVPAVTDDGISVYFSPKGGCTSAIVVQVDGAKMSVDVLAYAFTSTDIIKSVADAHERGVKVRVILDAKTNDNGRYSGATYLFN